MTVKERLHRVVEEMTDEEADAMLRRIEAFTFEPRAERDLARLDPPAARRVIAALDRLLERDPSLDLRRQSSLRPFSRLSGCSPTGRHSRSSDRRK